MLKSPSRNVDADMEQMKVNSSDRSDRKVEEAFGGQTCSWVVDVNSNPKWKKSISKMYVK